MTTVVSLTPVSLRADARTLRIALSFARMGFRSVVVEGDRSGALYEGHGLEIISVDGDHQNSRAFRARKSFLVQKLRAGELGIAGEAILAPAYLAQFLTRYFVKSLTRIPAADLYYLHSFEYFPAVWVRSLACGGKIAYDAHDCYASIRPPSEVPSFDRHYLLPLHKAIERACVRRADLYVTVSDGLADLLKQSFGRRPLVCRNCHEFRLQQRSPRSLRREIGISNDSLFVVSVGNFKSGMPIEALAGALNMLDSPIHLAFIGSGYSKVAEQFRDRTNLSFLSASPPSEITSLLREADIGLVPYRAHSANYLHALPNGFFQLASAGLPLVCPDLPHVRRLTEAYGAGLIMNADDPSSIAHAFTQLQDPALRKKFGAAARRLAVEHSWEQEEKFLSRIICDLLGADGPGSSRAGRFSAAQI